MYINRSHTKDMLAVVDPKKITCIFFYFTKIIFLRSYPFYSTLKKKSAYWEKCSINLYKIVDNYCTQAY